MSRMMKMFGVLTLFVLIAAGCGDDDGGSDTSDVSDGSAGDDEGGDAEEGGDDGSSGGGGGTLVLGDETIVLDSARCFLAEQDAAAGGGKILFTGQGFGTNAAGEDLVVDVSRYDEESQFTGDDILVDIGDPFSDDFVSFNASGEIGMVNLDGSTMSTGEIVFLNPDDGSETAGSLQLDC